jgi:hypothetical protein
LDGGERASREAQFPEIGPPTGTGEPVRRARGELGGARGPVDRERSEEGAKSLVQEGRVQRGNR